jgi:peptidoglycan/xylan/chitin deacetylase (PgdA/CDA1 family)
VEVEESQSIDLEEYNREAQQWGENVDGVKTRIDTEEKKIALTFDACGGQYGNGYDQELISFLEEEQIPATLFINQRWIEEQSELFLELAENPLFQIENHGTEHVPLSVNGGTAWGIEGTQSPEEVETEVLGNHERVLELTGRKMSLFRSGTAFYDEVAVELVNALGYEVVNFNILGDAGATYTAKQVESALLGSEKGAIALLHMNQPESGTAAGVKAAVPKLQEQGYQFVRLDGEKLE